MKHKTYLIGIQPTGKIHIGNYLGCLKKGLDLQNEGHNVIFLIANYHSLTTASYTDETEKELRRLGCLNIKRQTPEYTEKFFELCCKMNLGTLLNMPQYKEKKENYQFDLGLLLYPALMTADIVMNDPDPISQPDYSVIVGKDQVPHLELCNEIAHRIGGRRKYEYEFGNVDKIMSLADPLQKMSKSLGEHHVLYLFDEDYMEKLKRATTTEEGVKNLKMIAKELGIKHEFHYNLALKNAIADRMYDIFKYETVH